MRLKLVVAAALTAAGLAVVPTGPAQALHPVSGDGWSPRNPKVCSWNCFDDRYPRAYESLAIALAQYNKPATYQMAMQEAQVYNASMSRLQAEVGQLTQIIQGNLR